jgi:heptosyltransferase II
VLKLVKTAGWILATLPKQFAQILSVIIGDCLYFMPSRGRRTVLSNLHHAFPEKPRAWRRRKARLNCRRLVEMKMFNLALPFFSEGRLDNTLITTNETTELLRGYTNPAKPVIGITVLNCLLEAGSLVPRSLEVDHPEISVVYHPLKNKLFDDYTQKNRSRFGVSLIKDEDAFVEAEKRIQENKWIIFVLDQPANESGNLSFFLNRAVTCIGIDKLLNKHDQTDVLAFYGERTGFWQGNLHVEKISHGDSENSALLEANEWLEDKLRTDEKFSSDWMWVQDRWNTQNKVSQNLNLDHPGSLIEECKQFYDWESLPHTNRIWFRMPDHLGNLVKWLPLIKAVRESRPDAEITLLANRQFEPLLEAFCVADRILPLPKRGFQYFRKIQSLRKQFPDTYYQLLSSQSADLEAKLIDAPRRYGMRWPSTTRTLLSHTFDIDPGWDESKNHQKELWKEFLQYFGLKAEIDYSPLTVAARSEVINPLRCLQTETQDAPYFGLNCGAGNHPEKCWPVDYWVELVADLMDLYPDSNICFFGTSADLPVSRRIIEQFEPGSIHDFTGSTNLMQFVMALRTCTVVISNDCGGLHLANALGVPTIGLYGVTNPVNSSPVFDSPVRIIQPSDCPIHGGTPSSHICLSQIIEAVADLVPQKEAIQMQTTLVS